MAWRPTWMRGTKGLNDAATHLESHGSDGFLTYGSNHAEATRNYWEAHAGELKDIAGSKIDTLRARAEYDQLWKEHTLAGKAWEGTKKAVKFPFTATKNVVGGTVSAASSAISKTFKTAGLIGVAVAGAGALTMLANSSKKSRKYKPGDENLSANAQELPPLMTPDALQQPMGMSVPQPQGRQVLGPMTARVLGQEAGGLAQPKAPDIDGKEISSLGSSPSLSA